jgi:CRISPR-associated protein Csy2
MAYSYLLLPQLEVQHANALSSYWAISPECVMAARQMGHALARSLGAVEHEAGVAMVHHHVELLGERLPNDKTWKFRLQQRRAATFIDASDYSSKNTHAISLQPVATMHLRVSLVLRFHAGAQLRRSRVEAFLHGGRLAGGQVVSHGEIEILGSEADAWGRITSGHVVVERPDLMRPAADDVDLVDAFFRAVADYPDGRQGDSARRPWVVPATLGYAAISPIEERPGAREGWPAAFAEPLMGLVQYQPIREARQNGVLPFWDYAYPEPGVFVVTHAPRPVAD